MSMPISAVQSSPVDLEKKPPVEEETGSSQDGDQTEYPSTKVVMVVMGAVYLVFFIVALVSCLEQYLPTYLPTGSSPQRKHEN